VIFQELPTPHQLDEHPELASLALLDTAIEVASYALAAAEPALPFVDEHPNPVRPELVIADAIIQHATALQRLIGGYCQLTATPSRPNALAPSLVPPPEDF